MSTGMDFYNDAELAAVSAIRLAVAENDGRSDGATGEMHTLVLGLQEKHGTPGVLGLVTALARHAAIHVERSAERAEITPDAWLDDWALHKMDQHRFEAGEGL